MRVAALAALAVGMSMPAAGCGGPPPPTPMASADATRLRADVGAVRQAAGAGQPLRAHQAVAAMRAQIHQMLDAGRLSSVDGRLLLREAGQADRRISVEVKPRVTPTPSPGSPTTTSVPQSTPSGPQTTTSGPSATSPAASRGDHGPGHGQGHGHGGGDGGD